MNVDKVRISDPSFFEDTRKPPLINIEHFEALLEKFLSFSLPRITSSKSLALELAKRTRFLKDEVIAEELREEARSGMGKILGFYEAFRTYLIRGLTKEQFADLYSQTLTYGLFSSRLRCKGEFNRKRAVDDIPRSIGILREMFDYISLGDLPVQLEWIVDDIANILSNVNVEDIFSEYFTTKKEEDPVFHFYETFLSEYDPKERERRGVYYTPKPVVTYIVLSLHKILKDKFGFKDGLANENVTILDPAAGTLTFIITAIRKAVNEFVSKYGDGGKQGLIKDHILNDFYAFELMIAPYAVGHLKVSFLLNELGYELDREDMKFYLTNTLELEDIKQTALPGMASLSEESRKAGEVKKHIPIWVILGNPPYSGISANKGKWITKLIADYRRIDGKSIGEKNPKWLQDDYVKFIRFAEWKINKIKNGVVGYITNHSFLNNPTFRGMRKHLIDSFDEIFLLDLHGSALKREKCPDGSKDENIFDIRQGVAISLFIKKKGNSKNCRVFHSEIWGLRERKYEWLDSNEIMTTGWTEIHPHAPFYLFVPIEERYSKLYNEFWNITDIFQVNSVGVVSSRDKFVVDFDVEVLRKRIKKFRDNKISDQIIREEFKLRDKTHWKLKEKRIKIIEDQKWEKYFKKIAYRPFDERFIFYHPDLVERRRFNVMRHMLKENIGLLWTRPMSPSYEFSVLVTKEIIDQCVVGNKTAGAGISYIAPLILYNHNKKTNINRKLIDLLKKSYEVDIDQDPDQILFYIYAVLSCSEFSRKYNDFLKIDFPRLPFTKDHELFKKVSELGEKLVELQLMRSKELDMPIAKFIGKGNNIVEKLVFNCKRLYINETQYFDGVTNEIWTYQIGGYKVLSNWLKARKGQRLSFRDIRHLTRIITTVAKTIEIKHDIDKLYPRIESQIIPFQEKRRTGLKEFS